MKTAARILLGVLLLAVVGLVVLDDPPAATPTGRSPEGRVLTGWDPASGNLTTGEPVRPALSPAVRDLIPAERDLVVEREIERHNPFKLDAALFTEHDGGVDPLLNLALRAPGSSPTPTLIFDGIPATGYLPPDTIGDVGPDHYVQAVNMAFQIWDKAGNSLAGPYPISSLWQGQGTACELHPHGDPVVLYDSLADRWLLSQFIDRAIGNAVCVAISTSADPTGSYYLYQFSVPEFPDYYKFGLWPDAYYMAANEGSYTAYAFDRTAMVAGDAATFQRFEDETNMLLPADLDGSTPPPAGTPGYFYTFKDNSFHGGVDRLEVFAFDVDWETPADSTFNLITTIPIASFNFTVCGYFNYNCIPQLGTSRGLDAVSEWPMWRLQYRNFGTYQTMVGNFTVDVSGSDQAGIRWFELRKLGAAAWSLYQEGTHAPDAAHRWMGSIAMDGDADIALGYSVSSASMYPTIRYVVRQPGDPLGTMQAEPSLPAGGGSQLSEFLRWGDYSSLNVDPADDCTFWYTNEYYATTSSASWRTRIVTFKVPGCVGSAENQPPVADAGDDQSVNRQELVALDGSGSSDPDGHLPLVYLWEQTGGPVVSLSNPSIVAPTFTAPSDPAVLTFTLAVTDSLDLPALLTDEVVVTVVNQPPGAEAGPNQIVKGSEPVVLDGSGSSDPDGDDPLEYLWTQTGGTTVSLSDPASVSSSFTAPSEPAVLTFTLAVTDSLGLPNVAPDQVVVAVKEFLYLPLLTR